MANTKIINVLGSDSYEDVYNEFATADAEEVIFILPKSSRFSNNDANFEMIQADASRRRIKLGILSSDNNATATASKYGFNVLGNSRRNKASKVSDTDDVSKGVFISNIEAVNTLPASTQEDKPVAQVASMDMEGNPAIELIASRKSKKPPKGSLSRSPRPIHDVVVPPNANSRIAIDDQFVSELSQEHEQLQADRKPSLKNDGMEVKSLETIHAQAADQNELAKKHEEDMDLNIKDEAVRKRLGSAEEIGSNQEIADLWADEERRQKVSGNNPPDKKKKRFTFKFFSKIPLIITGGALIVLALVLFFILGSAKVFITPAKQDLNFQLEVVASNKIQSVDVDEAHIPGQLFAVTKTQEGTYQPSGEKEVAQKARGEITIFNETATSQTLVATTRFRSSDGLIYRIPKSVTVPAKSGNEPGSLVATVFAAQPGDKYNIGADNFVIPGFEGTPKFKQFYAKSQGDFTGGIIGPAPVVTQEDYDSAQKNITQSLRTLVLEALREQSGDLIVVDSIGISQSVPLTNVEPGEAADELQMSIEGRAEVLAFRASDLEEIIEGYVSEGNKLEIIDGSLNLSYSNIITSDDGSQMSFDVQVTGTAAAVIDLDSMKQSVLGLDEGGIRAYFNAFDEVERVNVKFFPGWARWLSRVPSDPEKVEIILEI